MPNAFIRKLLLSASVLLAGCQVPGALTPSGSAPVEPAVVSPLAGVDIAHSRDILVRLRDRVAQVEGVLPEEVAVTAIQPVAESEGIYLIKIAPGQSLLNSIKLIENSEQVAYAHTNPSFQLPDYQIASFSTQMQPNDPNYGLQWNMRSAKIEQAWDLTTGNKDLVVAVIDSGVDPNHPDLVNHLLPLEDVWNSEKGQDVYRNPFSNQMINFGGKDGNGHGTHVTGVIAASLNNQVGVAGVAGGGIKILPIKATDYAGNTDAAVLTAAFQRAIDKGADVINISIGGPASKSTRALVDVIQRALALNISIVSATGNESNRRQNNISPISVPAAYPNVIAVGAHTEFDRVASYSNGGPETDILAPGGGGRSALTQEGQQIWSTWPSYQTYEFLMKRVTSTMYAATSGTSMACPHVTGVVALMLSREPGLTPAQIRSRLIATADDIEAPGFDEASGYGKLNALRALQWTAHDARD